MRSSTRSQAGPGVAGGAQQLACSLVADSMSREQWRGDAVEDRLDRPVQLGDLAVETGGAGPRIDCAWIPRPSGSHPVLNASDLVAERNDRSPDIVGRFPFRTPRAPSSPFMSHRPFIFGRAEGPKASPRRKSSDDSAASSSESPTSPPPSDLTSSRNGPGWFNEHPWCSKGQDELTSDPGPQVSYREGRASQSGASAEHASSTGHVWEPS